MALGDLLEKMGKIMEGEPRLLRLPPEGKVVFVGDTHGDLDATEKIIRRYLRKPYRIAFLGDYVDRGRQSEENIQYLLRMKCDHPDQLFLLAGNHEGFMAREFYPADFWNGLSPEEKEGYGLLFAKFPFAITSQNGILGVHGGLPEVSRLEEINQIEWGGPDWEKIVWGDFVEEEGNVLGSWGGRLQLGRTYFEGAMKRFERRLLVRSHQPHAPRFMFKKRCVTIFTSKVYLPTRTILIADMERDIRRADDVTLETI